MPMDAGWPPSYVPFAMGQRCWTGYAKGAVPPDLAIRHQPGPVPNADAHGKGLGERELKEMSAVARDSLSVLTDSEIEELHSYRSHGRSGCVRFAGGMRNRSRLSPIS